MKFSYPENATPLDLDEIAALIPKHITTQEELNAWEEKNILNAERWASKKKDILSISFIKELHFQMFNKTWGWAGQFRISSSKNIGIDWHLISSNVKNLCDNIKYQLDHEIFSKDEIAIRFHHQLVWIHSFPNGNGRHARLISDLLIKLHGRQRFSWGGRQDLSKSCEVRRQYIEALRSADRGDYSKLIIFART